MYSNENMSFMSVGTDENRFDKTQRLVNSTFDAPIRYLNVCGNYRTIDTNCSICEKCCMTILMLDIIGKTDIMKERFDIPMYRKLAEKRYIAKVLVYAKQDPYYQEIIQNARQTGYSLEAHTTLKDKLMVRFIDSPIHNFLRNITFIHAIGKAIKDKIEK